MNKTKIISALLIFVMLFGAVANLSILPVFAAETAAKTKADEGKTEIIDYRTTVYATQEEKLATMELAVPDTQGFGYELYYHNITGEIAVKNTKSGMVMFSNPYDVAAPMADGKVVSDNIKNQILSQIIIKYTSNDTEVPMFSYVEAALRNQITKKNLKNGIRVEYILGRQETRKLVPRYIEASRFEELIVKNITDPAKLKRFLAFYTFKNPDDPNLTERAKQELQSTFPITKKMAVYVFDPDPAERELNLIESIIREFCPNYTYETLQEDHLMTEYSGKDNDPALFRMSLEYTLDQYGLTVRLPANGIKFNEATYSLNYIRILPYFGAGSSENKGYTMIPDGSGTLLRFEDIVKQGTSRIISGQLYGQDYAYHEISGAHQQVMRMPVFGVVENYKGELVTKEEQTVYTYVDENGETQTYDEPKTELVDVSTPVEENRGYVAIIEEGDALAKVVTDHGGNVLHKYNSVYTEFYPRPKDSYNLAASMSVGANATWTVVSKRKYTGNYRIRYIMLTDDKVAAEKGISDYYEVSYVGMAKAYRDFLEREGVISKLSVSGKEKGNDIPLYIETLGVINTQKKILSMPVMVKTPLTTFDDLKEIYSDLSSEGVTNINFRLKGFTNGGMYCTMPFKVEFEKTTGGDKGYEDFLAYAKEHNIGLFPEFDFSYQADKKWFDGFSYRTDAIKTIDSRYTRKRVYSAALQFFEYTEFVAVSPSVFGRLFNSFSGAMDKIGGVAGVSVASLGSDLNSDFNKKNPYNREDSKEFVIDTLNKLNNKYSNIMVDGGNAYTLQYVSHVLNVSLDSSRYTYASESIPLFGMVFHGYLDYAGSPTNMAGDINYETLKIIENGSAPYFLLVKQNVAELKESGYSEYYSVSYDIWRDDLIAKYKELNEALSSVKYEPIMNHEFLIGERVPFDYEKEADEIAEKEAAEAKAKKEAEDAAKKEKAAKLAQRKAEEAGQSSGTPLTDTTTTPATGTTTSTDDMTTTEPTGEGTEGTTEDGGYKYTKYTSDNGLIVRVTYANGDSFILNYNSFTVTVEGYTIPAISYIKIKG